MENTQQEDGPEQAGQAESPKPADEKSQAPESIDFRRYGRELKTLHARASTPPARPLARPTQTMPSVV